MKPAAATVTAAAATMCGIGRLRRANCGGK
jgi:hypothetical protein